MRLRLEVGAQAEREVPSFDPLIQPQRRKEALKRRVYQDSRSIADTVSNRLELRHSARDLLRYFPGRGDTNIAILITLASGFQNKEMELSGGKRHEASAAHFERALAAAADIADALTAAVREKMAGVMKKTKTLLSRLRNSWGWRLGAVLNSPGKHPFALDRRLDAGSGGPAARREVEVGLFRRVADRASEHRWVTDAGRAPRGVAGGALVMSPGVRAGRR